MVSVINKPQPDSSMLAKLLHEEWFHTGYIEKPLQLMMQDGSLVQTDTKDPSSIPLADGRWGVYVSFGTSSDQKWQIGYFETQTTDITSALQFVAFVDHPLLGPRACAPAVTVYTSPSNHRVIIMDVQTECFASDIPCEIERLYSSDGVHFTKGKNARKHIDKELLRRWGYEVSGVYDAGTSVVYVEGKRTEVILFSGYRPGHRVGFGDIYMISRELGDNLEADNWQRPVLVFSQDDVTFHNTPFEEDSEWGNEGAKVIQLAPDLFLWVFVSFLKGEHMKQRVTWGTSRTLDEKPLILGVPYPVKENEEHGHSDIMVVADKIVEIRQQRVGKEGHWFLVCAEHELDKVSQYCKAVLDNMRPLGNSQQLRAIPPVALAGEPIAIASS